MVRKIREKSLIISILLMIGLGINMYKWITSRTTVEILIGFLLFIALLLGSAYFILWFKYCTE